MSTSANRSLHSIGATSGLRASGLRKKLRRKLGQLRSQGLGAVLRKAFQDHVYRTGHYVILEWFPDVNPPSYEFLKRDDLVIVEPGDPLPEICRHFSESQAAGYEATLQAGCTGFFALKDGNVVGMTFGARQDYYEAPHGTWFPVKENECYMFGWRVAPGQRSFSAAARVVKASAAYMAARGCRRLYCVVDGANIHSLANLFYLGYQEAGIDLTIHRLFGRTWSTRRRYRAPRYARYQRKRAARDGQPA